jgi:hypothetical protein
MKDSQKVGINKRKGPKNLCPRMVSKKFQVKRRAGSQKFRVSGEECTPKFLRYKSVLLPWGVPLPTTVSWEVSSANLEPHWRIWAVKNIPPPFLERLQANKCVILAGAGVMLVRYHILILHVVAPPYSPSQAAGQSYSAASYFQLITDSPSGLSWYRAVAKILWLYAGRLVFELFPDTYQTTRFPEDCPHTS